MPKRRKCSPEFKRETVQLTLAEGAEISQLAQNWASEPIFRAIDAVNSLEMGRKHFPARAIPRRRNDPSQARIFSIEKETGFFAKSGGRFNWSMQHTILDERLRGVCNDSIGKAWAERRRESRSLETVA